MGFHGYGVMAGLFLLWGGYWLMESAMGIPYHYYAGNE